MLLIVRSAPVATMIFIVIMSKAHKLTEYGEFDKAELLTLFGCVIRTLRKNKCISQEELAHRCGLDRTYIGGVERGERNISLNSIGCLATGLETSMEKIFEMVENGHK